MSSDDYFYDEPDSAFLNAVDAIEAAHVSPPRPHNPAPQPRKSLVKVALKPRQVIEINDSDDDYDTSGFNDDALQIFDQVCAAQETQGSRASTSAKPLSRKSSMGTVQMNLFGQVVSNEASSSKAASSSKQPMSRSNSSARNPFHSKRTKQWDHTLFQKNGWKKPKGKGKASFDEEDEVEEEEETVEFEQFPSPAVPAA